MADTVMSTDWLSQPLSIKSIASKYTLPVVIRPALGFRSSNQSIILHSIKSITFAFGRALKQRHVRPTAYQSFRPIDSEIVAIPLKYPGYFECLLPSSHGSDGGIAPETSISSIVEQMQSDLRSRAFYVATPLQVYFLENNFSGGQNRLWQEIEAHQVIVVEQLIQIEYTPTEHDDLTQADYEYWLFCFSKRIVNRYEFVLKCILTNEAICYIPCASKDEVCLYPVGQPGSTNFFKLQTIENLIKHFSLPANIKLARFPGAEIYKDFNGFAQLLGSQTDEFAICASLSTTNVSMIAANTSTKFVVERLSSMSKDIANQIVRCDMFLQSFDKQIRRILIPSQTDTPHRSQSKRQSVLDEKRSSRINSPQIQSNDSLAKNRRSDYARQRATSASVDNVTPHPVFRRTLSSDTSSTYNSLIHPVRSTSLLKQVTTPTPTPPSVSKKSSVQSRSSLPFTYDTGIDFVKGIALPNADGAILLESTELFSSMKINNRPCK